MTTPALELTPIQARADAATPRPVLRVVGDEWLQGRGRYWLPNGNGYTDDILQAGLYERTGYGERGEPGRCTEVDAPDWLQSVRGLLPESSAEALVAEVHRLRAALNTPELHDFAAGVVLEAAHQRERWGADHDGGKTPADWFWLVGYLAGKALHALLGGNVDKALHHVITTAAALANWHAAISGTDSRMRPGIVPPPVSP